MSIHGISTTVSDQVATITLAMPGRANKVNAAFGEGLSAALDEALATPKLRGIIVATGHKDFCVGADLDVLYAERDPAVIFAAVRQLGALYRKLETSKVPVVAALTGSALGGGYELALACHHRIAVDDPGINLGLPEVNLGVIPGAGGTQRLPRLIGIQAALEILMQGKTLRAPKALSAGLVDALAGTPEEVMDAAREWIAAHPFGQQPWDRSEDPPGPGPGSAEARNLYMAGCAMLFKKTAGAFSAPEAVIAVVQEGMRLSFDRGMEVEARAFARLATSDQAKDMIRTFWYHRTAAEKHAGLPKAEGSFKKVAVLGAGMMGAGIGYLCASKGMEVVLRDINAEAVERGLAHARAQVAERSRHLPESERNAIVARITGTTELSAISGADLVIEAVFEDLDLKHRVIREVEPFLAPGAVFASNTSAIPIGDLARAFTAPDRFIGLHFFSPVEQMPLLEIITAPATSEATLARALALTRTIGKLPIVVNDGYGFYTTRVFSAYILESVQLVAEGHDPVLVEWAARTIGMVVPPLQVFDEVSLKLAGHGFRQAERYGRGVAGLAGPALVMNLVEQQGRTGKAGGAGFYDYVDGKRQGIWPGLRALGTGTPKQTGVPYLARRLILAQIAEVGRALADGVLRNHRDAEVGAIFGIGFAPGTGGPLAWMDRQGLPALVTELDALADQHGDRFRPAAPLREMARDGKRFFHATNPP